MLDYELEIRQKNEILECLNNEQYINNKFTLEKYIKDR